MKAKDHELVVFIDQPHGVAISLLATNGDITCFQDVDHAASYPELTRNLPHSPTERCPGRPSRCRRSRKRPLRGQMVEVVLDHPGPLDPFFGSLTKRKKYNIAVTATARKMVTIAYLMLKHNEPYRYAKCEVIKKKLADCRRQAKGTVRKTRLSEDPFNDL